MFAAAGGNKKIVQTLINKGVDVNAQDLEGQTALMLASRHEHQDIIKILNDSTPNPRRGKKRKMAP